MEGGTVLIMQITRGKISKPQKVVIYGPEGVGKSTFASKFPDPLFIDTEDSTVELDVARFPRPSSWTMLLSQIEYIKKNPTVCKTLVVDTADWAERLCIEHICSVGGMKGIEDWGYGKGYVYLEEEFGRFLNKLQEIIEIGITVVVTAHAEIKKIEQPEEIGGFDHWQLKLEKKTMQLLKEWSDILLLANYKVYVVNVDNQGAQKGKNKAQGGKRVMYTSHTPWWDAKNRHGLQPELDFDYEQIKHCIERQEVVYELTKQPEQKPKPVTYEIKPAKDETIPIIIEKKPAKDETIAVNNFPDIPKPLADLMAANNVTTFDVQRAVASKGYYPQDTPIENYDPGFVSGVLVGAWAQVYQLIEEIKKDDPF
jgi:hypothetical protein